ncbi:MAG TPA: hemolysin family protein [Terriglobales bacterium]|nr:hemolysin family protein [Terriglobales bacterium]
MTTLWFTAVMVIAMAVLALTSYVQGLYTEMGKFLSRDFQENIEAFERSVEPRLGASRQRASLSMSVLSLITNAAIAMLLMWDVLRSGSWTGGEVLQASILMLLVIIIFHRLLPYVLFSRTKGEWLVHFLWPLRLLIYLALPVTLVLGFTMSVAALTKDAPPEEPEHPSEAVDALIEAGREEGILEEGDRELIQSVVEFGDKTVHEVMTPRPNMFVVPADTTVEAFTEILRQHAYSRVPVCGAGIDDIRGIVFAHDLLQVSDAAARTTTVAQLMRPAQFVPEAQRVSSLLREMQRDNNHMAIVVDEYGGVAGLVTIEDMVEEIVGEIRDEHEEKADVVRESDSSYIVPGTLDVDRLDDLFSMRLEDTEATTVSGLVTELLGRIPASGETVERDGLRFEILQSSPVRVESIRITQAPASQPKELSA